MKFWHWMIISLLGLAPIGESYAQSRHTHHDDDNVTFLEASPRIGEPLPGVSGYDEQGNEFSLGDLKGHFTVLICGCLT